MVKEYSLKKDGEKNLSKNFKVKEFACKDGSDKILIDSNLVEILQKVRDWLNEPVVIISGYRTPEYNSKINGAKNSYHCKGQAVDIRVLVENITNVAVCGASAGAKGIGRYNEDNFVHLDTRENFYQWEK